MGNVLKNYLSFWGKANDDDSSFAKKWHPAALHMLDVAAVADIWLAANAPVIPGLRGASEVSRPAIITLIALHDLGKFSLPFQAKRADLWPPCLGPLQQQASPRHDTAGFGLLTDRRFAVRMQPAFQQLFGSMRRTEQAMLWRAVCGHHGSPPVDDDRLPSHAFNDAAKDCAAAFITDLFVLLRPTPLPDNLSPTDITALSWWLAGFTVLADWVGSAEAWFPYDQPTSTLEAYWPGARANACRALAAAGLDRLAPNPGLAASAILQGNPPTPIQALVQDIALGPAGSPALVIIEDQTGSGKTEAALLLAHRLMIEKQARGLFIALPTMATADALHARLARAYRVLFAAGTEPSLVLAHGKRHLNDRFAAALLSSIRANAGAETDADETATAQCAAWIGQDRRRAFMADCGVGTIDQALHGVLPTRHAPLRLFGLCQRVLIIDEAHAYDAYMREELHSLLTFQTKLGGSTIILSATLPLPMRQKLINVFREAVGQPAVHLEKDGYPLLTAATSAGVSEQQAAPRPRLSRVIDIHRLQDQDAALTVAMAAARRGAAVAWLRNTVDDALAAHAALAAAGVSAILFHARYAMGDRLAIEERVQRCFGKDSQPGERRQVVVGTQVMEQSLDIDFDVMISDIAPIDLLLQRAGRLWRHPGRARVETSPCLYVVAPDPVAEPGPAWLKDFRGTARVYENQAVLWRSARAIFERPTINIPADVRALVEQVYADGAPVPDGLASATGKAEGAAGAARAIAWQNLLAWQHGYAREAGAWASDVRTPTRLAEPGMTYRIGVWEGGAIKPCCKHGSKSWAMSEITIPAWRAAGVPEASGARAAAVAALRASWGRWEQDILVLLLDRDGTGTLIGINNQPLSVQYSPDTGLVFN